jgi:hypothetical protein
VHTLEQLVFDSLRQLVDAFSSELRQMCPFLTRQYVRLLTMRVVTSFEAVLDPRYSAQRYREIAKRMLFASSPVVGTLARVVALLVLSHLSQVPQWLETSAKVPQNPRARGEQALSVSDANCIGLNFVSRSVFVGTATEIFAWSLLSSNINVIETRAGA